MRTYRIVTGDGTELATVQAGSVAEVIATAAATLAPLDARILSAEGSKALARRELWPGGHLGWSLLVPLP